MSLDLKLMDVDGDEIYEVNLTYNYSQMWALAMDKVGKDHDPPRSFLHKAPEGRVRLVEIEEMTGKESLDVLHQGIEAMVADIDAYRALNPANGWGNADMLLQHLRRCHMVGTEYPEAVWSAYR